MPSIFLHSHGSLIPEFPISPEVVNGIFYILIDTQEKWKLRLTFWNKRNQVFPGMLNLRYNL